MKSIIIKGVLSSLPLIVIAQIFFYLTIRSEIPSYGLVDIKPILYGSFGTCAIGFPVYFYFSACGRKLLKMLSIIAISWGIFSFHMLLSASITYSGLAKDMEFSLVNMSIYVFEFFIIGTGVSCAICVPVALIIEKLFGLVRGTDH